MSEVTQLLNAIAQGDTQAAADLLPIVYKELHALASARMANQPAGHSLNPTALVHEAYLKLIGKSDLPRWEGQAHFFGAAAEAMRQVLVDSARRKKRQRHGGSLSRIELSDDLLARTNDADDNMLAVDQVVDALAAEDAVAAKLVKLHIFAGFTLDVAAETLGLSTRTGYRKWAYARVWMFERLGGLEKS